MSQGGDDFSDYETTTFDPGWTMTIAVIVICSLMNLSLPLLLRFGKYWEERRTMSSNTANEGDDSPAGDLSNVDVNRNTSDISSPNHVPSSAASAVSESHSTTTRSVVSYASISQIASDVMNVRTKKGHHQRHHHIQTEKWAQTVDEESTNQPLKYPGSRLIEFDDSSACPSVMSQLDQDAVSAHDAIDAQEGSPYKNNTMEQNASGWQRLVEIAAWEFEMKRITALAIPYGIQGISAGVFELINVAFIGNFVGVREANVYVVVAILLEFTATLTYGFIEAMAVLGPQADGAGNDLLVGRYLQLGIIFFLLGTIPGIFIWSFLTERAVLWFGFDQETADIGQAYAYPFFAISIFDGLDGCLHEFLDIMDHEKYSTVVQILHFAFQTLAVIVLAAAGYKDLVVIGIVQAFISFLMTVANFSYVIYKGWLDDYWEGLVRTFSLRDRKAVHTMMTTAIPLGISYLLTYGEWEVMTIFAGFMGPAEVAAWGIVGFLWDAFEYLTEGLASAANLRVGFYMGAGQPQKAKFVAQKSIYLGVVTSIFSTGFLFVIAEYLPRWLTPDPTLQRMIFQILPLMGFGNILNVNGTVCWSIVAAQGRVRLATAIEIVSSWFLVLPISAIFVYAFNYNLVGPVGALIFGYSVSAITLTYILVRSPWEALSEIVVARHGSGGVKYDDFDWADLPPEIREAAEVLGYNKKIWDNDKEPASSTKDWDELSRAEQEAATLLGYNRKKWNGADDGSTLDARLSRNFDDCDWDELPADVQKAAEVLAYNKKMWDSDAAPPTDDKDWHELSATEQEAARKLGYNKGKWNGGSDPDEEDNDLPATNYDDCDWNELPAEIKKAAKVLGYDKKMWDSDAAPPSENKSWKELSATEEKAARKLGYNEEKWNDGSDLEMEQDKELPAANYDDCDWDELPADVQKAAEVLAYNKKIWDSDEAPPTDDKDWHELSVTEQEAARKLGYNKGKWNGGSDREMEEDEDLPAVNYDDCDWNKLPTEVKKAAKVLGYDKKMWDSDAAPPSENKSWQELSAIEHNAATKLGYNKDKWNDDSDPEMEEDEDLPASNYADCDWNKLPAEVKKAAKVLGYDQTIWDSSKTPPSANKSWQELSAIEHKVAKKLGYNKENWNGGSDPDYDDCDWNKLPDEVKKAAKVLGYDQTIWDSDAAPPSENKSWQELNATEQEAARKLGYNKEKWNDESDPEMEEGEDLPAVNYDDCDWDELPAEIVKAAKVLGYNKKMWDSDEAPPSENKFWQDLSATEHEAARKLGYNKEKWNDGSDLEDY